MMATAPPQPQDLTSPESKDAGVHKDEMTVFQVENRLFRVHRHFLAENSLVFSSMFSLPRTTATTGDSTAEAEGTSDANPIHLPGVTELEFETLLRYFYKSMHDGFSLPQPSWIALLSIAHHYEFLNVRERAIREIYGPAAQQPQDHMLLISVAEKYDVSPQHLIPSLVSLVTRPQPLSEGEVASYSALTVSRIAHAREDFVRRTVNPPPLQPGWLPAVPNGPSWKEGVARDVVCKIWQVQNDDESPRPSRRVFSF
ncbi:hypothetical protein EDB92DRAFT_1837021 [Lactarius akahatsu]|uniref:BTB domain-containing protein n=1 Tax=Lactarius akahatsu TaxID=416441 RepID=A0AAD4QGN5_9AGAM|nr:hypothetical protein EDB92DRAFT_1837021 [Lactarius akahatsu]